RRPRRGRRRRRGVALTRLQLVRLVPQLRGAGRRLRPRRARGGGVGVRSDAERDHGVLFIVALVVVLNLIGLVMVLSASSVESLREYGSSWFFFERQVAWVAAGAGLFVLGTRIDPHRLRRIAAPLLLVALALLVLVLVPGLGVAVNGSRRWLGSGSLRFQP